jgi:cytochrome P450
VRFREIGLVVGQSLDGVWDLRQARELATATRELVAMFARLAAERRADPRDDVVTRLAAAERDNELVARDLLATCGLLLVAGFEATVNLIGNGVAALQSEPALWHGLAEDPALAVAAVDLALGLTCPSHRSGGEAGHRARRSPASPWASGRADACRSQPKPGGRDPDRFDPRRSGESDHLAFGSGIHYCLGASLARLEGEIAFRTLAQRSPDLRLLPNVQRRSGATIRGFTALPVAVR